jgi:hypothetical protein
MALIDNLIEYWKMNESSGNCIGSFAAKSGTVTGATQGASGKIATAYSFDGSDNVDFGDDASFDFGSSTDWSISLWFNTTSTDAYDYVIAKYGSSGWGIELVSGALYVFANDGIGGVLFKAVTGTVNNGSWHHLVATFDRDGNCTTYLDGGAGSTASMSAVGNISNSDIFYFGRDTTGTYQYNGSLDAIGVWNKILTSGEASELWNSGNGYEGFLATYDGTMYRYTGSLWEKVPLNNYEGSFSTRPVRYWNGSSWQLIMSF